MKKEKTCYNCGNKNCNQYWSIVKVDTKDHYEFYEYVTFICTNHNRWTEYK